MSRRAFAPDSIEFKPLALALAEALIEDLSAFAPFAMATMSEYGKVGGYAPAYVEVKIDAFEFITLCEELQLPAGGAAAASLPEIVLGRLMQESFFEREKEILIEALRLAGRSLRQAPDAALNARWGAADADLRRRFETLIRRSGLDEPGALSAQATPPALLGGARKEKVYVSSRYSSRLQDQIAEALAEAGADPIGATVKGETIDLDLVERDLRECVGGVFGLSLPAADAAQTLASERALTAGLAELALAERRMGRKMMILAQETILPQLPSRLRARPIFKLRDQTMDETEYTEFKSMAARTPWLH